MLCIEKESIEISLSTTPLPLARANGLLFLAKLKWSNIQEKKNRFWLQLLPLCRISTHILQERMHAWCVVLYRHILAHWLLCVFVRNFSIRAFFQLKITIQINFPPHTVNKSPNWSTFINNKNYPATHKCTRFNNCFGNKLPNTRASMGMGHFSPFIYKIHNIPQNTKVPVSASRTHTYRWMVYVLNVGGNLFSRTMLYFRLNKHNVHYP